MRHRKYAAIHRNVIFDYLTVSNYRGDGDGLRGDGDAVGDGRGVSPRGDGGGGRRICLGGGGSGGGGLGGDGARRGDGDLGGDFVCGSCASLGAGGGRSFGGDRGEGGGGGRIGRGGERDRLGSGGEGSGGEGAGGSPAVTPEPTEVMRVDPCDTDPDTVVFETSSSARLEGSVVGSAPCTRVSPTRSLRMEVAFPRIAVMLPDMDVRDTSRSVRFLGTFGIVPEKVLPLTLSDRTRAVSERTDASEPLMRLFDASTFSADA